MAEILRIIDRFAVADRGLLYTVKPYIGQSVCIGDIYMDLKGNRFLVKGIEMIRRSADADNGDDGIAGILFESVSKVEANGHILVKNMFDINFLFCNHPLFPRKVDEDYEAEYDAAKEKHTCALFSYEDLERGKLSLYGEKITGLTIYRGWMMKPEMYRLFYKLLEEKDIILINTPEEYERYHMLPNWYEECADHTAYSVWEEKGSLENALNMAKGLDGPFIVKDYVKSRKHEWYDACFIKNISDKETSAKIISNFIERQGTDLIGGVVLRRFEKLKQTGFHEKSGMPLSEEYRVFIYAGNVMIIDDYWCEGKDVSLTEAESDWLDDIAGKIQSNFVTVDFARREDGKLIIIEMGDGQVSGIQQINPEHFYFAFHQKITLPVEDVIPKGAVILAGDPWPDKTAEEVSAEYNSIVSTQQLADIYAGVYNKFWYIEDDIYDYEEGTAEYTEVFDRVCKWEKLMEELTEAVIQAAEQEGLISDNSKDSGLLEQLEPFMEKYGYQNGLGWWVPIVVTKGDRMTNNSEELKQ